MHTKSEAKTKASAANGAKGGKPVDRTCPACLDVVRLIRTEPGLYRRPMHGDPISRCSGSGGVVDLRD